MTPLGNENVNTACLDLKRKYSFLVFGTCEYWKARAECLERAIDETVVIPERENYKAVFIMLRNKELKH